MSIEARERGEIYSEIPSIQTLAEQLQQASVAGERKRPAIYAALVVMSVLFLLMIMAGAGYRLLPVNMQHIMRLAGNIFYVLLVLTYAFAFVKDALPIMVKILLNPTRTLEIGLDEQIRAEEGLVCKLVGLPADLLLKKQERLDAQLTLWDRRVESGRLFGQIGTPILVAAIAFVDKRIGFTPGLYSDALLLLFALLVGVYLGAIFLQGSMELLHRVSYVLKNASEQNRASEQKPN